MKTARVWTLGLALAFLALACAKGNSGGTTGAGGGSGSCGTNTQMECNGSCIDIASDSQNCGTCGYVCDTGTICQGSTCVCASGFVSCSGQCVPSNTDHCGTSCAACPSGNVCNDGQCSSSCAAGSTMCMDGACSSNTDSGHCGSSCTVCSGGATCNNGACTCAVSGQQNCDGTCIDTSSNINNCGSCGNACGSGQSCSNGTCMGSATGGTTGSGGSGNGGSTGNGGSGTGGSTGNGGSGTGGSTGTGGSGTGGTGTTNQQVLVTSANNAFWKTNGTLTASTATATVMVNDNTVKTQKWEGFGGAFNELGWSYIQLLSASDQAKVMDLLFGADAAHFAIGRIPIGASDYAVSRYTDDETAGDTTLKNFSITEDTKYLIPYAKAALKVNPSLRFWASPWTPPTWMKTTTSSDSNGTACKLVGSTPFDGGCMSATYLTPLATYLSMWVSAYNGMGIPIDTISPQNEPNYAQGYPSCLWNTADYVTFFKGPLATAFPSSGSTKIMLGTMSNGDNGATSFDLKVVQAVEADSAAKAIPKVMGLQWGMLDLYNGLTNGIGPSNFMTGSLPVWATEHKCGNYPWITNTSTSNPATGTNFPAYATTAPNDLAYGVESWAYIRNAINKGGVTAYNAWNMVLDTVGTGNDTTRAWAQDALLTVNTSSKALIVTPAYYVFRHCAQYVQIGAKVVTTSGGDAIAFKNPDGSEVAVMYNSGGATTYTIAIAGKKLQFAMPAAGWATVFVPAS